MILFQYEECSIESGGVALGRRTTSDTGKTNEHELGDEHENRLRKEKEKE